MTQVKAAPAVATYREGVRHAFLDNRGLEPPTPMIRTLETLAELGDGDVLTIHNDRVPVFLLPQLLDMGAAYVVAERDDGSAIVTITKGAGEL